MKKETRRQKLSAREFRRSQHDVASSKIRNMNGMFLECSECEQRRFYPVGSEICPTCGKDFNIKEFRG